MTLLTILLIVYFAIAVGIIAVMWLIDDPYDPCGVWQCWTQAILVGVFWLPVLLYVVGTVVYYQIKEIRR